MTSLWAWWRLKSPASRLLNVYSGADQRKHQSSASLTFVCGIHKQLSTRKMFPFDDVIMCCLCDTCQCRQWRQSRHPSNSHFRPTLFPYIKMPIMRIFHWNWNVVILTKFTPRDQPEIIISTNPCGISDDFSFNVTTCPFQCLARGHQ